MSMTSVQKSIHDQAMGDHSDTSANYIARDAGKPVLGALGGMATAGILGMFVGATVLTLGYRIFTSWVADNPDADESRREGESPLAD